MGGEEVVEGHVVLHGDEGEELRGGGVVDDVHGAVVDGGVGHEVADARSVFREGGLVVEAMEAEVWVDEVAFIHGAAEIVDAGGGEVVILAEVTGDGRDGAAGGEMGEGDDVCEVVGEAGEGFEFDVGGAATVFGREVPADCGAWVVSEGVEIRGGDLGAGVWREREPVADDGGIEE